VKPLDPSRLRERSPPPAIVSRLFVTGGGGFVGSRLVPALHGHGYRVAALDRTGTLKRRLPDARDLQFITGDLLDPASYAHALGCSDIVVHLAAATGRATRGEHLRVNASGTETLVNACRRAGVTRFLFVSSIAAAFPDRRGYHYAEAKVRAEAAVRSSGLAFCIIRPTMIFGPGSPVQAGLEGLALLPIVPVFGNGRTSVQPIHVDDVVRALLHVIESGRFTGETFELGGGETLAIESLLRRIGKARRGRSGRVVHLPLALTLPPLRLAEAVGMSGVLPVTAGQLSSFRFAGTAGANPLQEAIAPGCRTLADMLAPPAGADAERARLERECRVLAAHLLAAEPDAYIRRKYADAHFQLHGLSPVDRFERTLIQVAATHRTLTAMADAYARTFFPESVLRRKLVLLLALLESASPSSEAIDRPVGGGPVSVMVRLVLRVLIAMARLVLGTALFMPARLLLSGRRP
jgi:NADH dehydrogenase